MVKANMVLAGREFKVLRRVIQPVAVFVVNDFVGTEGTTKHALHDRSMFSDLLAGNGHLAIPKTIDAPRPASPSLSFERVAVRPKHVVVRLTHPTPQVPVRREFRAPVDAARSQGHGFGGHDGAHSNGLLRSLKGPS